MSSDIKSVPDQEKYTSINRRYVLVWQNIQTSKAHSSPLCWNYCCNSRISICHIFQPTIWWMRAM